MSCVYQQICIMKDDITIPEHFPEISEEKLKTEAKHREEYSRLRDLQAEENNEAIAQRMTKVKENNTEDLKQVKSENGVETSQLNLQKTIVDY